MSYDTMQALSGNFNLEDVPKSIKFKIDFKKITLTGFTLTEFLFLLALRVQEKRFPLLNIL